MSDATLPAIVVRIRREGLRLRIEGSLITVHDTTMPGLSFALPFDTPLASIADVAIDGARARRRFILGVPPIRSAA